MFAYTDIQKPYPLPLNYIVRIEETFSDSKNVNIIFEYLPGNTLLWVIQNHLNMKLAKADKMICAKYYSS
jgi:serine/threonine protein kinase